MARSVARNRQAEYEAPMNLGDFISILKLKARRLV
jgi:hypothetical protein